MSDRPNNVLISYVNVEDRRKWRTKQELLGEIGELTVEPSAGTGQIRFSGLPATWDNVIPLIDKRRVVDLMIYHHMLPQANSFNITWKI